MKFKEAIDYQKDGQNGRYQKGQHARDAFNNLYVLQGIGKDQQNVWLLVRVFNHIKGTLSFQDLKVVVREVAKVKKQLRKPFRDISTFAPVIKKCVKTAYYNENKQSAGYGRVSS